MGERRGLSALHSTDRLCGKLARRSIMSNAEQAELFGLMAPYGGRARDLQEIPRRPWRGAFPAIVRRPASCRADQGRGRLVRQFP